MTLRPVLNGKTHATPESDLESGPPLRSNML
jgi:hypothetical protein